MYVIYDNTNKLYYVRHSLNSAMLWTEDIDLALQFPAISDCQRYITLTMKGVKGLDIRRIDDTKDHNKAYDRAMKGI